MTNETKNIMMDKNKKWVTLSAKIETSLADKLDERVERDRLSKDKDTTWCRSCVVRQALKQYLGF